MSKADSGEGLQQSMKTLNFRYAPEGSNTLFCLVAAMSRADRWGRLAASWMMRSGEI